VRFGKLDGFLTVIFAVERLARDLTESLAYMHRAVAARESDLALVAMAGNAVLREVDHRHDAGIRP
jgi:hypothetical protein